MARKGTYRKRRDRRVRRARRSSRRCWTRRSARRTQSGGQCAAPKMRRAQSGGQMQQSLAQGQDYLKIHSGQYGGGAVSLAAAAPVGDTGMLDESLRAIARVAPLDQANAAIQGMRDQSGGGVSARRVAATRVTARPSGPLISMEGGRRRAGKRNAYTKKLNAMRKNLMKMLKKASRSVGLSRRRRNMRGGAAASLASAADYGSPGMLLSPAQEAKALMGMNPEWRLAENPNSFAPKMA